MKILSRDNYDKIKVKDLVGRYITNEYIIPLFDRYKSITSFQEIGKSVEDRPVYGFKIGSGSKRILMWSQMHGNESTTTKAVFDFLNYFCMDKDRFRSLELYIIPILNPDGANAYTRLNANQVDLNRDAQNLTQPESVVLRNVFNEFKPHYCFNLHGQRTIFSAGNKPVPATLSFLAPAQDRSRSISSNRLVAMHIIGEIFNTLKIELPDGIGLYDDSFNLNCVGDTFQYFKTPTLLFEAGHFPNDYQREETRYYVFNALLAAFNAIIEGAENPKKDDYAAIPLNQKLFYDVIIRKVRLESNQDNIVDIGVQFKEVLKDSGIYFQPIIEKIGDLSSFYGHKEYDGNSEIISTKSNVEIKEGFEIVFAFIKNKKIFIKA